jgi:hypothetical protein
MQWDRCVMLGGAHLKMDVVLVRVVEAGDSVRFAHAAEEAAKP